jgi:nucleotide-binding universal stress UspA family protein
MQQTILIPIDGTESADETLLYVQSIAPKSETRIVLIQVTPHVDSVNAVIEVHPNVNTIHNTLEDKGWKVEREARIGDPVREIIKMAILLPATLILMSTHGRSGVERIRKGSVTEQVLKQSPCPVFILHSSRPEPSDNRTEQLFRRILVPLDGTDASSAILECVERFAKMHDSEVVMFHDEIEHAESDEERAAIKAKLRPIREILDKIDAMNIDLVSMATHGDGGERRAMDESVTAEVVRHSNCPLLVWSAEPQCPPEVD